MPASTEGFPVADEAERDETDATPAVPDASAINEVWRAEPAARGGLTGWLESALWRLLGPRFEAQRRFNATQVQLDNELLRYLEERLALTHRHYDRLLTEQGHRLDDVDARHRQLEAELLRHVRDLVTRIDLVLGEANRDRLTLRFTLEQARDRLDKLEAALRREG
jgi:hypothetical protein